MAPSVLEVPGTEGAPVAIDWADIAEAEIVGGSFSPRLIVVPTDPDRIRPAPTAWQRAAVRRGPYRIVVPLALNRSGRAQLRHELAARMVRVHRDPPREH